MRIEPDFKYHGLPCAYVATGCAYEEIYKKNFDEPLIENLKEDGWSTLENTNKYIRSLLPIKKKKYFKRSERFLLREFLLQNDEKCIICVYGHFIFVDKGNYWSFFENDEDEVVCVWYIKGL